MNDSIIELIQIDDQSATPKYLQLAHSVINAIEQGLLHRGANLPSINELSFELDISRDTVEKAYKHLKKNGIIESVPGKGYFIDQTGFRQQIRVLLLFNKLSSHKKIIYDHFVSTLGELAAVDFYIYNNDFAFFKKLLQSRKRGYTHYVIVPHFLEDSERASEIINTLDDAALILLDKYIPGIQLNYSAVYEQFETDIYNALKDALTRLEKYHTLKLIFPAHSYFPEEIAKGFMIFCREFAFNYRIVHNISEEPIDKGEVYINLMEEDLVVLIERVLAAHLQTGLDVGIISYNETPIKKILLNGITTISTNFALMGQTAANIILSRELKSVAIPFTLTLRDSL